MSIKTTTIQVTSKTIKLQLLLSTVIFAVGTIGYLNDNGSSLSIAALVFGSLWHMITRIRRWWHHD